MFAFLKKAFSGAIAITTSTITVIVVVVGILLAGPLLSLFMLVIGIGALIVIVAWGIYEWLTGSLAD
jgi:hypothetical protein